MSKQEGQLYEFGPYRLLPAERLLLRDGKPVPLTPKAFETLVALVERAGHLADKDELLKEVWPDSFVEESNLAQNVFALRRALGEQLSGKQYIETVPKRGYRFIAQVTLLEDNDDEFVVRHHVRTSLSKEEPKSLDIWARSEALAGPTASAAAVNNADLYRPETLLPVAPAGVRKEWKLSLRFVVPAVVVLTLVVGAVLFFWTRRMPENAPPLDRSIAVLPFRNLGGSKDDEYLGLGLTDALITKLSNVQSIVVRPTSAVIKYDPQTIDISTAGRELKVGTVLAGSVQRTSDRVRVTVQLMRADNGQPIWGNTYDEEFKDIFHVQDEISARVVEALKVQLTANERERLAKRGTGDVEAYQLYLRGNYHLYRYTAEDLRAAIRDFNEALAHDPSYAMAYAGLANAFGISSAFGDDEASQRAEAAATKAVALDPTLAEAHAALAATQFWQGRNVSAAQDSFNRALDLSPNSALIHHYYAWFLIATEHFEEASTHMRRALEIDPLSPAINVDQGLPLFFARRYQEAQTSYLKALDLDGHYFYAHLRLGESREALGDFGQAVNEFKQAVELSKDGATPKAQLVRALALADRKDEARTLLREIVAKNASPRPSPYYVALAYLALDDKDQAFAWLDRAYVERDKWLGWINIDPRLDPVRNDSRFRDLPRRGVSSE